MKILIIIFSTLIHFFWFNLSANEFNLEKTPVSLTYPWGMTWLDQDHLLITQKSGEIFLVNTQSYEQTSVTHSIPFVQHGQGGLLDIISEGNQVWLSGSVVKEGEFTTAIYQAVFSDNALVEERPKLIADNQKIIQELNWHPRYSDLNTILSTAWQWEKN